VIFWLLLAATLCVDAVAFSWISPAASRSSFYASVAFHALLLSQLSIVCIWSALSARTLIASQIAPLTAVIVATVVTTGDPMMSQKFNTYLAYYGFHAVFLLAALWVFKRTAYWRQRSNFACEWRYSIAHLLIAMTVVAVLAVAMRNSPFFADSEEPKWFTVASACGFVALSIAALFIWSLSLHWLIRVAGVFGFAILLATITCATTPFDPSATYAHNVIQGIVLSIWLGIVLVPSPAHDCIASTDT
jgi:hypothetical protein